MLLASVKSFLSFTSGWPCEAGAFCFELGTLSYHFGGYPNRHDQRLALKIRIVDWHDCAKVFFSDHNLKWGLHSTFHKEEIISCLNYSQINSDDLSRCWQCLDVGHTFYDSGRGVQEQSNSLSVFDTFDLGIFTNCNLFKARENKFVVREFEYNPEKLEAGKNELTKLATDKKKQFGPLVSL